MPDFKQGAIVRVPFPYTDRDTRQRRPALVVSKGEVGPNSSLLWVVMITSAANRQWDSDVSLIDNFRACGLPAPSLIRTAKIATIDSNAAQPLGSVDGASMTAVLQELGRNLALA